MGMATGQGRTPETEVNSGGGNVKIRNFSMIKVFEIIYLMYESLLPYPYTKERKREIKNVVTGYPREEKKNLRFKKCFGSK